jgi:hypothetical protein
MDSRKSWRDIVAHDGKEIRVRFPFGAAHCVNFATPPLNGFEIRCATAIRGHSMATPNPQIENHPASS